MTEGDGGVRFRSLPLAWARLMWGRAQVCKPHGAGPGGGTPPSAAGGPPLRCHRITLDISAESGHEYQRLSTEEPLRRGILDLQQAQFQ